MGKTKLVLANPDGSGAKDLTDDKADNGFPAWSPDGKKIAFASDRDGTMNIYVMDADGSNAKNITNDPSYDADPAWSPDGKKIVFTSRRAGMGFRLYSMDP